MKTTKDNYEAAFMEKLENTISEMENESYEFPKRFSAKDYIVTGIVIFVCLIGVILGAFLT